MSDEQRTDAAERLLREGGGSLSRTQLDAAIFMGFDGIWKEVRELERLGRVALVNDRYLLAGAVR